MLDRVRIQLIEGKCRAERRVRRAVEGRERVVLGNGVRVGKDRRSERQCNSPMECAIKHRQHEA